MSARICPSLRSAREKLCIAQTDVTEAAHRQSLQEALDTIDRLGVFYCADWSRFDEPTISRERT